MKLYQFLLLLSFTEVAALFCPPVFAENTIKLSQDNVNNLGVILGKLESVKQIPVLTAPAKVVVPPTNEYVVSASQAGVITTLKAAVGDNIKKGEVLVQLNSPDLLSMQRLYLKSLSDMQLGSLAYERDKKLLGDGVIAERRWQETRSQYNAFVYDVNERKQLLNIAGMTLPEIESLGQTHQLSSQLNVHSPISGVVMARIAIAGERVDMLAPLYRIANLSELWLEINIPQERIGSIKVGDQVLIDNTPISAKITLLGQSVNPENQTLLARAVIVTQQTLGSQQSVVRPGQPLIPRLFKPLKVRPLKCPIRPLPKMKATILFLFVMRTALKSAPLLL